MQLKTFFSEFASALNVLNEPDDRHHWFAGVLNLCALVSHSMKSSCNVDVSGLAWYELTPDLQMRTGRVSAEVPLHAF